MNAVLRVLLSTNLEYNLAEAAKAMLGPTTTKWGNRQCFDLRFFYVRMVKSINETFKKNKAVLSRYEKATGDHQFTMERFKTNARRLKEVKESVSELKLKIR